MSVELRRPAFYALRPGGWRDAWTLLHPPYTAWHLSYYAIGAALASKLDGARLLWGLVAFFLAVGVAAHALDELRDRPLRTGYSDRTLRIAAGASLVAAVGIGIGGAVTATAALAPLVAVGAFIVVAYNLELFGGRFHNDFWFAAACGAFPALTGYVAQTGSLSVAAGLVAPACFAISAAQRRLSTPVRALRRKTVSLTGTQQLDDGRVVALSVGSTIAPLEAALSALSLAMVLLAAALVAARL
jgi:hypothetical protein